MQKAVGYLRTSSAANVGSDKDSARRQDHAIRTVEGVEAVAYFYDAAVKGGDPVDTRPGFAAMMDYCREHGIGTIIVEAANRFSRDLIVQETGYALLKKRGIALVAADDPDAFTADTPTAVMVRQILGAVAQFEKATTVDKLRGARDRASERAGRRVEGRKGYSEANPRLVREAKRLARRSPKTGKRRSLRQIAAELDRLGYSTLKGTPFAPMQVRRLLEAA